MAAVCTRSIDPNPHQPLLAYPVCGGAEITAADYRLREPDQQQTRSPSSAPLSEAVDRLSARPESW